MLLSGSPVDRSVCLSEILRVGLDAKPDGDALVSTTARWTWRQLEDVTTRLAVGFVDFGLRPGDRIASLMPNRDALVIHYLACAKAGLVSVPLNYRYTPPEIDFALTTSGASALVVHAERDADVRASRQAAALRLGTIRYGGDDTGARRFEDLVGPARSSSLPSDDPSAPVAIFFTSGSTGRPKGVTHTRASLAAMITSCVDGYEFTPDDVMLPASSLSHIVGYLFSFVALAAGVRTLVAERFYDPDDLLSLLRRERPTILSMIPVHLFSVVRAAQASRADFASLRLCQAGGDTVPDELSSEFETLTGHTIHESYGCSEVGAVALSPPSKAAVRGSVGRPLPGVALSLRDDTGDEVPPDEVGRLWIRTPARMAGYWNDEAATDSAVRDGWFDSGDLMTVDDDGYLWFRGRRKEIIVHDGSNIYPQEVENALLHHPAVVAAGVVGVADPTHGENVRAYVVVPDDAEPPTAGALVDFARQRVGYKTPEDIVFVADLPLNPAGKVDRLALQRMAAAGHDPD
ncbi:class I adenylate-forming enzyme family protein [Micromonospora sp. WMMA1363]|uniref:class I adenylate-forming enzyme family protein n=1 Tax=Micromonospora sp. WMMA1363 TaxID=3053985 RepID=UPI00259CCFF1|nr:class I adenylate-forming enzyme family protein [Micromonospora sp. WMMA1363]MDM4719467.1 class I adenylate-forming enzyme family protein [Micromonospora sp. WMMA1363]